MAKPSTQQAAAWVKNSALSAEWTRLSETLQTVLAAVWTGKSPEAIADFVDEHMPYVAEHLRDEMSEAELDGATCSFEIDDEDDPYIRRVNLEADEILGTLKSLCPFAFEDVCMEMLVRMGGEGRPTKRTRDGGIDFVAIGIDILPEGIKAPVQCRATVIGQAKRFTERLVPEKALREFVGATVLKRNELRIAKSISPLSPILLAFWTTSNFDPNCKAFAREAGVWLMDGHTLSTYVSRLDLADWLRTLPKAA
jgi:restriction endonuclease Mrr